MSSLALELELSTRSQSSSTSALLEDRGQGSAGLWMSGLALELQLSSVTVPVQGPESGHGRNNWPLGQVPW